MTYSLAVIEPKETLHLKKKKKNLMNSNWSVCFVSFLNLIFIDYVLYAEHQRIYAFEL